MVLRLDLGADIIFPSNGGNLVRPWEHPLAFDISSLLAKLEAG